MKRFVLAFSGLFLAAVLYSFTMVEKPNSIIPGDGGLNMPENVKSIVDNSCYGCHHTDSKNEKGKKKLNFDSFGSDYSGIKSMGKLKEIAKVVQEGDMPPQKFLDHYPEKALNDEQKKELSEWALQAAETFK